MVSVKRYCCLGCGIPGAYIHIFPHPEKQKVIFEKWMDAIGGKLKHTDPWRVYKTLRICDIHFTNYHKVASHRLARNAVPTEYLNGVKTLPAGHQVELEHNYSVPGAVHPSHLPEQKLSTLEEPEDAPQDPQSIFSWQQQPHLVPTDERDGFSCRISNSSLAEHPHDISLYRDDVPGIQSGVKNADYRCNECHNRIVGFRYTCVQCADWDLCGACEARAAHGAHYMLRVPRARPYKEVQALLAAVRNGLLADKLGLDEVLDRLKSEPVEDVTSELEEEYLLVPELDDNSDTDSNYYPVEALDDYDEDSYIIPSSQKRSQPSVTDNKKAEITDTSQTLLTPYSLSQTDVSENPSLVSEILTSFPSFNDTQKIGIRKTIKTCSSKISSPRKLKTVNRDSLSDDTVDILENSSLTCVSVNARSPKSLKRLRSNSGRHMAPVFMTRSTKKALETSKTKSVNNTPTRQRPFKKVPKKPSAKHSTLTANLFETTEVSSEITSSPLKTKSQDPTSTANSVFPDKTLSENPSTRRIPRSDGTFIFKLPKGFHMTDFYRALKVSVQLEPLRIEKKLK